VARDRVASKDKVKNRVRRVERDTDIVRDKVADKVAEDDEGYVCKLKYSKCQPTGWHI
jgi:hypothetical protein